MRVFSIVAVVVLAFSCTYDHLQGTEVNSCTASTLSFTYSITKPTYCSSQDGSITVKAKGGAPEYSFKINNGNYSSDTLFTNLGTGNYTVTVKDSIGCTQSEIISLNSANNGIAVSTVATADGNCSNNGSITVTVTGGKEPFDYSINSGTAQSSNVFKGLAAATYSITVTDSTGCQASASATIANTPPSFANDISPIISSNCAISGCHNGSRSPNLNSYSNIASNASSVLGAINSNMPPGGKLTQQQINVITCWAQNGKPDN